jgi:uncharacterized protein (TIGR02466 family)
MFVINLNAIPVFKESTNFLLKEKEVKSLLNLKYISSEKGSLLSVDSFIFKNKIFKRIKNFLNEKVNFYKEKILEINNEIYLTQSWSTICKQKNAHHDHIHPNTFLSAVFYVKSKDNTLKLDLNRSSLAQGFNFEYNVKKYNIYNSGSWSLPVNTGDVVIFPGWLKHGSVNSSNEDKILIGSNYFIKGEFGNKNGKDYDYLKI